MLTPPTAPSPGKPVSAGFFARLIAWVKSGQLVEGPGYRLRRGPNGTSLVLKEPKTTSTPITPGCFAIEEIDTENKTVKLINCYYQIGGYTYNDDDQGILDDKGIWSERCSIKGELAFLCLVLPAGRSRSGGIYLTWHTWNQLEEEQANASKYVIPLYAFDTSEKKDEESQSENDGEPAEKYKFSLACDMRNAPRAQMMEFTVE